MPKKRIFIITAVVIVAGMALYLVATQSSGPRGYSALTRPSSGPATTATSEPTEYAVAPPPFSEGIFPCSQCHNSDMPPNTRRRTLKMAHTDIHLNHGPQSRWCLDCHDANNRDMLRLASGQPVAFSHSYELCGQCHGEKYRDWREGIHGKRTGQWNGVKQYLLCASCHNPHSPRYVPIKPMPPPQPPQRNP